MSQSVVNTESGGFLQRWFPARKKATDNGGTAPEDPAGAIAFGNRIIFYGLGLFVAWASMVPLDEGIPASGSIAVESMRKIVSHLSGGSVAILHVHENQFVKSGDTLITLDSTKARVAYNTAIQEYIAASAELSRLQAEQMEADSVDFPDELLLYAEQMGRLDYLRTQEQLFHVRRQALINDERILRESISAAAIQARGARDQQGARTQQLALLEKEIRELRPLVDAGYTARNTLLAQERQAVELSSMISELQARAAKETSTGAELRLRIVQRRHDFMNEVESGIAEASRLTANLKERIREARKDLDSTLIRAPVSGQVVELQARSAGSVITPGSKVMEIIPDQERLLIDVQVPVNLINKVEAGLITNVQMSGFADSPMMTIEGRVLSVSTDKRDPPNSSGKPYYLARIEITEKGMAELHGRQLRPGMPVSAIIKTGERSLLVYLLQPVLRRTFSALQEQ